MKQLCSTFAFFFFCERKFMFVAGTRTPLKSVPIKLEAGMAAFTAGVSGTACYKVSIHED